MSTGVEATRTSAHGSFLDVLWVFLRLGVTSFGGPIAHLGYFRAELIERRKWLDEAAYTDIIALCQFLPGPASSQVAIILGMVRAGLPGGFAAWLGFTIPSALALIAFAYGVGSLGDISHVAWLHGLKIVAVAVVAQAVWRMAQSLCPDRERVTLAVAATLLTLAIPSATGQIGAIVAGGIIGWRFLPGMNNAKAAPLAIPVGRSTAIASITLFASLLFGLPLLASATSDHTVGLISSFYRSGSLVFGGGHVVLPLLQQAVVPRGWIGNDAFLAGYGAAQAVPGPLFTFAAYLGAARIPRRMVGLGDLFALRQSTCRLSSFSSARCRFGTPSVIARQCDRHSKASMQPWSVFCLERFIRRSGQVRFSLRRISGWEFSLFCYWCFGKRRLGWWLSSARSARLRSRQSHKPHYVNSRAFLQKS